MLHAFVRHLDGLAPLPEGADLGQALWIDLERPEAAEIRRVEALGFAVPTLADMEEIEISNRLYREAETDTMTAVLPGRLPGGAEAAMPLTFILSPARLLTVRHHAPRPLETFPARADRSTAGVGSADRVFLGLVEEVVSRLADLLEGVGAVIDQTSGRVFSGVGHPRDDVLRLALEAVGQQTEVIARVRLGLLSLERVLSFYTAAVEPGGEADRLRGIAKALNRDIQALEVHADFLGNRMGMTVDMTLGLINLQQNNTVRILSVVAALFLPPTLIGSLYGMNFDIMPELHWRWGYPMALGLMAASVAGTFLLLRWKKWL